MALNSMLRRSASSLRPLAARLLSGQRSFSGGALFTAVTRPSSIASTRSFLLPSVSRCYYSARPAVKRQSSDESLIRVIESEIKCSEDSFEEDDIRRYDMYNVSFKKRRGSSHSKSQD